MNSIKLSNVFEPIAQIFGGVEEWEKLPVLDIGKQMGQTGYIDFITTEMLSAPIMRGVDFANRKFFVIAAAVNDSEFKCHTFFQRYPDYQNIWVRGSGGFSGFGLELHNSSGINLPYSRVLKSLIQNGECIITDGKKEERITVFKS